VDGCLKPLYRVGMDAKKNDWKINESSQKT
jgi:hypothetical protein